MHKYMTMSSAKSLTLDLNFSDSSSESDLNSLLVRRQIDNPSKGAVTGVGN